MNLYDEAYSDIRIEYVEAFKYIRYIVVSTEPEDDAIRHVKKWVEVLSISNPKIIGWDFPILLQEQINVFNMHGYVAALILLSGLCLTDERMEVVSQESQKYIVVTIKNPMIAPFRLIPNAYRMLMAHIQVNGIKHKEDKKSSHALKKSIS